MSHEDLHAALDALTKAHGAPALAQAMRNVRRAQGAGRKRDKQQYGALSTAIMQALDMRDELKAQGVTGAELDRGMEGVLRELWPKPHGRTEPWHDQCGNCRDYGLEMIDCPGDATCGFRKPHPPHEFGRPCWCPKGNRFRDQPSPTDTDPVKRAAKSPRQLTRFGR